MRALLATRLQSLRCFTTGRPVRSKVSEYQKIFQDNEELPVHLKRGTSDMLMYRATMCLGTLGTSYAVYRIYLLGRIKEH